MILGSIKFDVFHVRCLRCTSYSKQSSSGRRKQRAFLHSCSELISVYSINRFLAPIPSYSKTLAMWPVLLAVNSPTRKSKIQNLASDSYHAFARSRLHHLFLVSQSIGLCISSWSLSWSSGERPGGLSKALLLGIRQRGGRRRQQRYRHQVVDSAERSDDVGRTARADGCGVRRPTQD